MTYAGTRGNTATEMADVLHFKLPPDRLHPAFAALHAELNAPQGAPGYRLHTANALWAHQDYPFLPEFIKLGQTHYHAGLETLDFVNALEPARQTINTWVAQRTEQRIPELIPPGVLDQTTKLVPDQRHLLQGRLGRAVRRQGDA